MAASFSDPSAVHKSRNREEAQVLPLIHAFTSGSILAAILVQSLTAANTYGGNVAFVRFLLQRGAEIHAIDERGWSAIHYGAAESHVDIVEFLLSHGASANERHLPCLETPLHVVGSWAGAGMSIACRRMVRLLLRHGADLEIGDRDRFTPLIHAAQERLSGALAEMLGAGADVHSRGALGRTALIMAAIFNRPKNVAKLLDAGARVDDEDALGDTALMCGSARTAIILVAAGADVNHRNRRGDTALHIAARCGQPDNVRVLLDAGARRNLVNNRGVTAWEVAKRKGFTALAREIRG